MQRPHYLIQPRRTYQHHPICDPGGSHAGHQWASVFPGPTYNGYPFQPPPYGQHRQRGGSDYRAQTAPHCPPAILGPPQEYVDGLHHLLDPSGGVGVRLNLSDAQYKSVLFDESPLTEKVLDAAATDPVVENLTVKLRPSLPTFSEICIEPISTDPRGGRYLTVHRVLWTIHKEMQTEFQFWEQEQLDYSDRKKTTWRQKERHDYLKRHNPEWNQGGGNN